MALRAEVVDFVGLGGLHDAREAGAVGEVAVVQHEAPVRIVGILLEVVDALSVKFA
jgi:hypothetical protein